MHVQNLLCLQYRPECQYRRYCIQYRQDRSLMISPTVAAVPHTVPSVLHMVPLGPFSHDVFYNG